MIFLFIFAFSMAFYLLMSNDEGYASIPLAMLTTSVMMVGEIDYRNVFLGDNTIRYIVLTRLFLFCFLIIITIVIVNLLVGLAVGDTTDIMKRSKAEKRFFKVSFWSRVPTRRRVAPASYRPAYLKDENQGRANALSVSSRFIYEKFTTNSDTNIQYGIFSLCKTSN